MSPIDSNDARWFSENLRPHHDALGAWLRTRYPAALDVEDIIQESYLRVLRMRREKEIRSPKAVLYTTARNLALDAIKSFHVSRTDSLGDIEDSVVIDSSQLANDQVARDEELKIMTKAIQSLPDRCRQIFTLRKVYGMSQKEVARTLELSEKTVSAQIAIGMRKCTSFVARYCAQGGDSK